MSKRRGWQAAEARMLSEFVAARWPDAERHFRVRVGSIRPTIHAADLTSGELRAIGVYRRWVDAVVIEPGAVTLIEASVKPDPGHIAQLEIYLKAWPMTPEYAHLEGRAFGGMLVYAVHDPLIAELARERGLAVEIYSPEWVLDYLRRLYPSSAVPRRAP